MVGRDRWARRYISADGPAVRPYLTATRTRRSNVLRVRLVLLHVAAFLALVVHRVLLEIRLVNIVGRHAEGLGERHQEVEEVDDLDLGVLLVELLVLGPPLPRHAVDQLSRLLLHGAGIIEDPLRLFLVGRRG